VSGPDQKLDGVRLAVLTNRLESIVRKMTNTLFRTARSGVINTARDFSCCIVTGGDELLAAAESIPILIAGGPELVTSYMKEVHPVLRRGDAFLHNSPYHGSSHAADHGVLVPVIDDDGVHRFTLVVKAHVADCGNSIPSSMMPGARDVYEEGALIFPCVRIQQEYAEVGDVMRMCEARIRAPELWRGDLMAMVGAARVGERELLELAEEVGWAELDAYVEEWFAYSEERMVEAIRKLPAGRASAETTHDPFAGVTEGLPIRATVEVDPERAVITVDLRDNPDCLPNGMNLTESTARACALTGVLNGIPDVVPVNAAVFRRVEVLLRENCMLGIPLHPTSCSLATTHPAIRAINVVQRALAELGDGIGMAESGSAIAAGGAAISGFDARRQGERFVGLLFLANSAGAASPFADGWIGASSISAGMMYTDSVEVDEALYPFRVWVNRFIPDSEGAGRFRGSSARHVEWSPVGVPLTAVWMSDGNEYPALGARGGLAGALASQRVRRRSGEIEELPAAGAVVIEPEERLISFSTSGGGYGPPDERDPDRVALDVSDGYVTAEQALAVYRVALDGDGLVDRVRTAELRAGARS
jgi:N-methylhydantoinase B